MSILVDNPLMSQEIPDKGAVNGHIRFVLSSRKPEDLALIGFCANITASLLFERMQAQGTNIIMHLEQDHVRTSVLARHENDGLQLLWEPKAIEPGQMNEIQERIRNRTFFIGKETKEAPQVKAPHSEVQEVVPSSDPKAPVEVHTEEEEDYLTKQLHRIP